MESRHWTTAPNHYVMPKVVCDCPRAFFLEEDAVHCTVAMAAEIMVPHQPLAYRDRSCYLPVLQNAPVSWKLRS